MLDIKFIRQNLELVKTSVHNRGMKVDLDRLLALDEQRRRLMHEVEEMRAEKKKASKSKPTPDEIKRMRAVSEREKKMNELEKQVESEYRELLAKVPNLIHPDVPVGQEEDFTVLAKHGKPVKFNFEPNDHETLMKNLDLIDFERGAKVAASKFYFLKNDAVRLNQALLNYSMDIVIAHGYELVETPDVAKNEILEGIGFSPRGPETQVYSLENTDLSLIGTAEVTMGGYHADEVLDLSGGPKKYAALSHCFRTEAGSYGRESKGLYRVHQFTKLEMFVYCKPAESEKMHREILKIEREICDGLGLAYRVVDTATGDLGAPAYRKFDLEAWMVMKSVTPPAGGGVAEVGVPQSSALGWQGRGGYGEITSTSNCTDYQARRLNIKYRKPDGTTELVHTLNGTAVVSSRFPLAIFEQFQQKDGSIKVPKVLQKYMGKAEIKL